MSRCQYSYLSRLLCSVVVLAQLTPPPAVSQLGQTPLDARALLKSLANIKSSVETFREDVGRTRITKYGTLLTLVRPMQFTY